MNNLRIYEDINYLYGYIEIYILILFLFSKDSEVVRAGLVQGFAETLRLSDIFWIYK